MTQLHARPAHMRAQLALEPGGQQGPRVTKIKKYECADLHLLTNVQTDMNTNSTNISTDASTEL
eukprot:2259451-Amphidinium_carterae.1